MLLLAASSVQSVKIDQEETMRQSVLIREDPIPEGEAKEEVKEVKVEPISVSVWKRKDMDIMDK